MRWIFLSLIVVGTLDWVYKVRAVESEAFVERETALKSQTYYEILGGQKRLARMFRVYAIDRNIEETLRLTKAVIISVPEMSIVEAKEGIGMGFAEQFSEFCVVPGKRVERCKLMKEAFHAYNQLIDENWDYFKNS